MTTLTFEMRPDEINEFIRSNSRANLRFMEAGDDYVAARCLILNALLPGFPLFSQSVEKLLKAMYYLETGTDLPFTKNSDKHNPFLIKQEISKHRDFGLDQYDDLLKRLHGHYQTRYFENRRQSQGMSTSELDEFDTLWWDLFCKLEVPIEVKLQNKFSTLLLRDEDFFSFREHRFWCLKENKSFGPHFLELKKTYDCLMDYLYPGWRTK